MGLLDWFRRTFGEEPPANAPAAVGWQGREVTLNPTDAVAMSRNDERIRTLEAALAQNPPEPRRASLEAELSRRLRMQPREV